MEIPKKPEPTKKAPSRRPIPKMQNMLIAGSATTLVVWVLSLFGVDTPATAAAAITTIFGFVMGYMTPPEGMEQ